MGTSGVLADPDTIRLHSGLDLPYHLSRGDRPMTSSTEPTPSEVTWRKIANACRRIGLAGFVGLILLIGYNLYQSREANNGVDCFKAVASNVAVSDTPGEGVRVIGIQPDEVELNRHLCIRVDNVVSAAKQNALASDVTVAAIAAKVSDQSSKMVRNASAAGAGTENAAPGLADVKLAEAVQTKASADLDRAKAALDDAQKPRTMVLYLNGKASPLTATARAMPGPQTLTFEITAPEDANSADAAYWRALLATPTSNGRIPVRIGVAEQGAPAPLIQVSEVNGADGPTPLTFLIYRPYLKYGALVAIVAISLLFFGLSYDTTLLRIGREPDSAYSLALVQMAIWFILTTTGFVYIWVVTGQYQNVFTSGLFVLIGISGATATAAFAMERGHKAPTSNGLFYDIVGAWQGGEVQLQRVQILVWTLILALIFFWNVLGKLMLTSFDTNLLILTGIANGVYVSLKPQEPKPTKETGSPPAAS